jgi:hypothetical protein
VNYNDESPETSHCCHPVRCSRPAFAGRRLDAPTHIVTGAIAYRILENGNTISPWEVGIAETTVTLEELLVSSLAQTDAVARLLIEKGIITKHEFLQKVSDERATHQRMLKPIPQ